MPHDVEEDGGEVDGEEVAEEPSAKHHIHQDSCVVFRLNLE